MITPEPIPEGILSGTLLLLSLLLPLPPKGSPKKKSNRSCSEALLVLACFDSF
jgi:hypothetical protein